MEVNFDKIIEANVKMKLTPISGKDYAEVNQRVKGFRFLYPEGTIETELVSNENGVCIFKAIAKDECGKILSTGTAYEKEGDGFINKTSYIENCETSAVGRCLGFIGLGIDTSIASFEEVANAKEQQKPKTQPTNKEATPQAQAMDEASAKARVLAYVNKSNMTKESINKLCHAYKVKSLQEMSGKQCEHYINFIKAQGGQI